MHAKQLFFFYHIPKTGGRSLIKHFSKAMLPHREFVHLGGAGFIEAAKLGLDPFENRPRERRDEARVLMGHKLERGFSSLVRHTALMELTFLREPVSRWVSAYNQAMQTATIKGESAAPFESWYDRTERNFQICFLRNSLGLDSRTPDAAALEELQQELQKFLMVGTLDRMDEIAPFLFQLIGLDACQFERKNVSEQKPIRYITVSDLSQSMYNSIRDENSLDLELVEYWKARQPDQLKRLQNLTA